MTQRKQYIDGCSALRVKLKRKEITEKEYQRKLMVLGRECQEFLLGPIDDLVGVFKAIKEKSGAMLDGGL